MYRKAEWTKTQIDWLGRSLKTAVEAPPKPKKERYWDEKEEKYKFRLKEIKRVECPKCRALFYQKRPKQIFCQDFCRIRYWQNLHRAKLKRAKRNRIRLLFGS
jgi:hypothetical protein